LKWRELDSLSEERRLVLLAINKMYYLNSDNQKLSRENQALTEINERNVLYIEQIERDLRDIKDINNGLNEGLMREKERKKTWRNIALVEGGLLVITLALFL
jgi:hypothetical protein